MRQAGAEPSAGHEKEKKGKKERVSFLCRQMAALHMASVSTRGARVLLASLEPHAQSSHGLPSSLLQAPTHPDLPTLPSGVLPQPLPSPTQSALPLPPSGVLPQPLHRLCQPLPPHARARLRPPPTPLRPTPLHRAIPRTDTRLQATISQPRHLVMPTWSHTRSSGLSLLLTIIISRLSTNLPSSPRSTSQPSPYHATSLPSLRSAHLRF